MPFELNEKLTKLTPYDPVTTKCRIHLDANESFIEPTADLRKRILTAVENATFNRYPDFLAKNVCGLFAAYYGIHPELVTAGNGSDELISVIMSSFLQKGDKILTLAPDFSMYRFYSSIVECECIAFSKKSDFTVDIDQLIKTINKNNIKMLIFSNPCNPTSVGIFATDIIKLLKSVNTLVVLDEAYMDFWDQSLLNFVDNYDNLIILRTCSKAIGMAAIRLGFAVANKTLTQAIRNAKSPYNVNAITQAIGEELFREPKLLQTATSRIIASRTMLYEGFRKLESEFNEKLQVADTKTNFVYAKAENADKLYSYLISKGIVVRNLNGYIRVTAGTEQENAEVLEEIRNFYHRGV